jgi:hypothetical protein
MVVLRARVDPAEMDAHREREDVFGMGPPGARSLPVLIGVPRRLKKIMSTGAWYPRGTSGSSRVWM